MMLEEIRSTFNDPELDHLDFLIGINDGAVFVLLAVRWEMLVQDGENIAECLKCSDAVLVHFTNLVTNLHKRGLNILLTN